MFVLKGFMPNTTFANNNQGVLAPFGEISTYALTYSREKGFYKDENFPDAELITFTVVQDDKFTTLTQDQVNQIMNVAGAVYADCLQTHGELFTDQLLANYTANFQGRFANFEFGDVVQDNNGYWMPSYIAFSCVSVAGIDADNNIKIWFADQAFRDQYDDTSIVVVPPSDTVDDFFKTGTEVATMLSKRSPSETMYAVQTAKGSDPETQIVAMTYPYHDPYDTNHLVDATFYVLIYGAAGNNPDSINDAIINYLLANSAHGRDEWMKLLPDLFKRTEFTIVPLWSQYAIPNLTLQAGIYSSVANLLGTLDLIKANAPTYPEAHIDDNAAVVPHPYKSLMLGAVGSPDNRDALFSLDEVFPDYIPVLTSSNDFGRMSLTTQGFVRMLNDMIILAETMTRYTSVPVKLSKVVRNGALFLVGRYNNINYLVAAKCNFAVM